MQTNDILVNLLSDEEKKILADIENRFAEKLKEIEKTKYDHLDNDNPIDFSEKHPEAIPQQHITDCPHEIKISVIGEVSEVDDKGYLKEVKEVFRKNYHIPVLANKNYIEYTDNFFKYFEDKLLSTCNDLVKTPEDQ